MVMLVSVVSLLAACSESATGPIAPASAVTKPVPSSANPDGFCDWINPWTRC
jgi:hypothetical protein